MNADLVEPWQAGGTNGDEQLEAAIGERQTDRGADYAYHEAFDEQLARNARRHRAQRGPEGELGSPRIGAHEHQIRDVRARHKQHRADRAHEHPERSRDLADHVVLE